MPVPCASLGVSQTYLKAARLAQAVTPASEGEWGKCQLSLAGAGCGEGRGGQREGRTRQKGVGRPVGEPAQRRGRDRISHRS